MTGVRPIRPFCINFVVASARITGYHFPVAHITGADGNRATRRRIPKVKQKPKARKCRTVSVKVVRSAETGRFVEKRRAKNALQNHRHRYNQEDIKTF